MDVRTYAEVMREHLVPMLGGAGPKEEVAQPVSRKPYTRLTARQRRQVEALSTERGYRPFQAWHLST